MGIICEQPRTIKISVIVPVYNTERYLKQCLHSLHSQTLEEIEIIVIDDASTDASGIICDKYASKDGRFRVIHKSKNEGLSAARNTGLSIAKAEYIMFVDSDDWVCERFCEAPYQVAKESGADLIIFQFTKHRNRKGSFEKNIFPKEGLTSKEEVLTVLWQDVWAAPWNKLYRRELFEGIQYPVGRLYEDIAVTHRIVYKAKRVYLLKEFLYHYRDYRPGSITNERSLKLMEDSFFSHFRRISDLKEWGFNCRDEETIYALSYLAVWGDSADFSSQCRKILNDATFLSGGVYSASWRQRVMFFLYKRSPWLFDFISIISGKRIKKV